MPVKATSNVISQLNTYHVILYSILELVILLVITYSLLTMDNNLKLVNCIVITPMLISIVVACVCPVQDASLYVPLWLGVTDELATLLTLDILTLSYNCTSPYANEVLWRLVSPP
jgi:hypothetical protein